ncbi:hypothetical protein PUN28_009973 [Cardiocondyla obscurior]|uniref:EGF-like domain-containing protein n=2 Tax=Cardiocondyla obscurior TaxID=286306 RepID=A0AAW2FPT8_9HYME
MAMHWNMNLLFIYSLLYFFLGYNAASERNGCLPGHFQCNNGWCIMAAEYCDRIVDCVDGSDEINCGYDEPNQSGKKQCEKDEYQCKNEDCIPETKFCDLVRDCSDGSDEYFNCVHDLNCTERFQCKDQHCIFTEWVCDGKEDCPDGSDEWNCSNNTTDCDYKTSRYLCKNQRCISLNAVCNEKDDCGDGSDEGAGCTSTCSSMRCNANSECKQTPKGSICVCKPGYELLSDNRTCTDIDECRTYGICDQECINTQGSYQCACLKKYMLSIIDGKQVCKVQDGEAMLAFSTGTQISAFYVDSKVSYPLVSNLKEANHVVINEDYIYWSSIEDNSEIILRKFSFHDEEPIVTTGISRIGQIAVDWVTENIYFTDTNNDRIGVCNNNGTSCTVLINGLSSPLGIVVDPIKGQMYWSEMYWNSGANSRIAVAGMDGRNIRTLVIKDLISPKSLTIDYPNHRLYWINSRSRTVESVRLNGIDERQIHHDIIHAPYSLAVFENMLYWSDWGSNTIQSCNKFSGKDWRILHRTQDNKPYGISIDHSAIKAKINNPCQFNTCSQLCIMNENKGYTCACTLDKELNADNRTCQEIQKKQHLLIVAKKTYIDYYFGILGKPKVMDMSIVENSASTRVRNVMLDPLSGQLLIHINEMVTDFIVRYDPSSKIYENITSFNESLLRDIAFDYFGNNLYITNIFNRSIEVHSIKTKAMTAFYFKDIPFKITLVPEENKMFIAFKKSLFATFFSLYKVKMDDFGENTVIKETLKGPRISMDYDRDSKTLYVSDEDGYILSYSNQETRLFRTGLHRPVSIAVTDNNIFWTEYDSQKLFTANLKDFSNYKKVAFTVPNNLKIPILRVITLLKGIKQKHKCRINNGLCSHVCLPSADSFTCACPPGMELAKDMRTCTSHSNCSKDEYKCSEHSMCIKLDKVCNGIKDCPNGEDETRDCEKHCKKNEFMCNNGECINSKNHCNSHFDCTDQSDEENCEIPKCKSGEYQCRDGTCILNNKVCDGNPDCNDFSDEYINCESRTCSSNEFMCGDRVCIPDVFACDGEPDCKDGTDEAPGMCKPNTNVTNSCQHGHFQCDNNNCISNILHCNGYDDCGDGSDEVLCLNKDLVNCPVNGYHCLGTNMCIPKHLRCNGIVDCLRHDDERDCAYCFQNEFTCDNMKCISLNWVCNKNDDCGDNSDEKNCDGNKIKNSLTINESGICEEFKCSVGTCLPYSKVCDGIQDCPDNSDENGKCKIACAVNNFCEHKCYKTPSGAVCGCQDGYRLAADASTCEDINECEYDVCSQICQNTIGSYQCSCYDGYFIRDDKTSCKAIGPTMEFITATEYDIRKISHNLHWVEVIHLLRDFDISGFDVNIVDGSVYWSNYKIGIIQKVNIETSNIMGITMVNYPLALAVDWITDNVYVIDNSYPNTIKVCNLEKQRCATLIKIEHKAKAIALTVDPINKWLFWSQVTQEVDSNELFSKIYRTDMTGADVTIIQSHFGFVTGMAIDYIKSKLYWLDNFQKTIESSNLDGSQHSTFLNTNTSRVRGISIFEQSIYWYISGSNGELRNCKLYGKKTCETLHLNANDILKYFTIFHISRQSFGENPCNREPCDHMCVLNKNNITCICSDGQSIKTNDNCIIKVEDVKLTRQFLRTIRHKNLSSVTILALLISALMLFLFVYYYYQKTRLKFNPAKEFTSIHFHNPSYDRSDEVDVTLNAIPSNLAPGRHEYINPIDDKFVKAAKECSEQKSDKYSEENDVEEDEKEKTLLYFTHTK